MSFIPENILIFDISSDFAQFRKYFTNMSPLTFSIPPRTAIAGILGAIIGIDKQENPENFLRSNSFISMKVINPVRKTKIPTNYIKTIKKTHFARFEQHKPTNVEYLKNPCFRIFVSHQDKNLYQKLKENLSEHRSVYTLNLGISSCLANFSWVGEFDVTRKKCDGNVAVTSIAPKDVIENITLTQDTTVQQCTLPNLMQNDREVTEYREFLFEVNGACVSVQTPEVFEIRQTRENILGM